MQADPANSAGNTVGVPESDSVFASQLSQSAIAITRIALTNFRSYLRLDIQADARPTVLVGPNGAGKTNLLDAISLLSPGRGMRGAKLGEHTRKGPNPESGACWAVAATVASGTQSCEIGVGLLPTQGNSERRQVRLNGATAPSSAELADIVQINWLTPAMDRLFVESASGRRRFLDRLVFGFDSGHARHAIRYDAAMRERARLLKYGPRDPAWLDGIENQMAESGVEISRARAATIARLNQALETRGAAGAFPAAWLSMDGDAETLLAEQGENATQAARERFAATRVQDAQAGRTTFGPHVSDLVVRHTAKHAFARDCSTGEQKALLISIVLAQAWEISRVRGQIPVLLLDEIVAHLDAMRRAALFEEILALGGQAWLTGTDADLFAPLGTHASLFAVAESQLHPISG